MNRTRKETEENKNIRKKSNTKNNRKRKKMKTWKKVLLVILAIIIAIVIYFIYNSIKIEGEISLSGMLATAAGHDENTRKNLGEFQVLIMGVSTDQAGVDLTDTIIVASYNPNSQRAVLLSIPRDSFTGKNTKKATASEKINAIYNLTKDPQETLDAVNELTGLDIKYYMVVKTEALIELVDAIGPIEYDVPTNMNYDDPTQDLHIHINKGMQEIDGEKAEQLLRFRKNNDGTTFPAEYGDNDIGRMRNQREFIMAVIDQTVTAGNITKLGQILDIASRNLTTNVDFNAVKDYLPYAVEFSTANMQTEVLPGTTPDLSKTNNVSIYVVDKEETETLIKRLFYPEEETGSSTENTTNSTNATSNNSTTNKTTSTNSKSDIKIEVINGSGDSSKLQDAVDTLKKEGYDVTKTGTTSTISKTIITNRKNLETDELTEIKNTLGVGNISTNKSSTSKVDVQIIIGKDFQ